MTSPTGSYLPWLRRSWSNLINVPAKRYPDPVLYWRARALRILMVFVIVLMSVVLMFLLGSAPTAGMLLREDVVLTIAVALFAALLYWLAGFGSIGMAICGWVCVPAYLVMMTTGALYSGRGLSDPSTTGCMAVVVLAALVMGTPGVVMTVLGSILSLVVVAWSTIRHSPGVSPQALRLMILQGVMFNSVNTSVFIGTILVLWDRAHRNLLEASLRNARAQQEASARAAALAELDQAKTRFFSDVSHEFRTPLTLLLGSSEEALDDPAALPGSAQKERLEMIRRHCGRLLKLVNSLLHFAQLEGGQAAAVFEPVDLSALTADLCSQFRSAMEHAGLRFVVDCPPLPWPVQVDRQMWEKIVLNLLSNALKFTLQGEVTVSLRAAGDNQGDQPEDKIELLVRDTGSGIPREEQPHLFQRFHRVRGARARTQEGSGIGLALIKELVRLHGGSIQVASEVDQGSTFTVTLPRVPAQLRAAPARPVPPSWPGVTERPAPAPDATLYVNEALQWLPGAGPKVALLSPVAGLDVLKDPLPFGQGPAQILVADDNADMRAYLLRLLGQRWSVSAVEDGQAALTALRANVPDLLLCDVMMPGLDGFELLRELRRDPRLRSLPVILLSARAGEESAIEGLNRGADDYLVKPFSSRELMARIAAHLELSRVRRQAAEAQAEFVRIVAHDLRGPLSALKMYSDVTAQIMERPGTEERISLPNMKRPIRRMERLIDDLLDVAGLEGGQLTLCPKRCDLKDVCLQAADEAESASDRDVSLELPGGEVTLEADPDRISQVLANLLGNAVKYSPQGAEVTLSLRVEGGQAIVSVRDEGEGIAPAELPHIFERFYRAPGTRKKTEGLGLGLYICRELVRLHGGRIWAESAPEKGSTFHVALPLAA